MKLMNLFARKPSSAEPALGEPEPPAPPIIRHELFRNDEARLYLDVNPGVGFAIVVAARYPGKVQPWLSCEGIRRIIRQMDEIVTQQRLRELRESFDRALKDGYRPATSSAPPTNPPNQGTSGKKS